MLDRMKNLREPCELITKQLKDLNITGYRTLMFGYKEINAGDEIEIARDIIKI